MPERFSPELIRTCYEELRGLISDALQLEEKYANKLEAVPDDQRESARNLIHYLSVRRKDIRRLQIQLSQLGLSSLGRLEAHVLAALESVAAALRRLSDEELEPLPVASRAIHFKTGDEILARHTTELLGKGAADRVVRIMVTLPSEAARDEGLVKAIMNSGMNVARINAAHDDIAHWHKMADNVRKAAEETGGECRILVDMPGPKLRTGQIERNATIMRVNPPRDRRGHVIKPEKILLATDTTAEVEAARFVLFVEPEFIQSLETGDRVQLVDVPGRKRQLEVTEVSGGAAWVTTERSIYFEPGMKLHLKRNGHKQASASIRSLPNAETAIILEQGDLLYVTSEAYGRDKMTDEEGRVIEPARIPCTLPEVFGDIKAGERIYFDDGKIAGTILEATADHLKVAIDRAKTGGSRLGSDKGINLPDSNISVPAFSETDQLALEFAVERADMVGYSFVKNADDVKLIHRKMNESGGRDLGLVLKIENRIAFENLPRLLLTGLRHPPLGVMVARGDLGVELGFERMAEVQEQILWLCEAAHVPVIWATQVLEQMNKKGLPSRGEVTDAAMSSRAECVMLNKGPYTVETVRFLSDILIRMQDHHQKKTPMLRRLKVSEGRWTEE